MLNGSIWISPVAQKRLKKVDLLEWWSARPHPNGLIRRITGISIWKYWTVLGRSLQYESDKETTKLNTVLEAHTFLLYSFLLACFMGYFRPLATTGIRCWLVKTLQLSQLAYKDVLDGIGTSFLLVAAICAANIQQQKEMSLCKKIRRRRRCGEAKHEMHLTDTHNATELSPSIPYLIVASASPDIPPSIASSCGLGSSLRFVPLLSSPKDSKSKE